MKDHSEVASRDARFLATLVEINHEITSILDLDLLLRKIAELTQRIVPYEIFAIMLLDEAKQELYHRFDIGYPQEITATIRIPVGQGIVGTAAKERKPIVVDDVRKDPRYINVVDRARSELAVPLISKNTVVGVLDIESPELGYFRDEQVQLLNLLASQIAIAIENARLYESERMNREMLALLHQISLEMASTLEVDELMQKIADAVKSAINYHIFSILLLDERQGILRPKIVIRYNTPEFEKVTVPLGKGLVGSSALLNAPIRAGDVSKDSRYLPVHPETRSELVIPLANKGRVIGVLDLESTQPHYFTEYHERFLMTLATRIASALVNAELFERVADNERRLERELEIARVMQHQFMPDELPSLPPLDIASCFCPVQELGGDLYDFIEFDDGRLAIAVGDVAGKGAPAALYGALASGIIRTRATRKYPPAQMLELVNKSLCQRPIEGQYVALTYAIYDPKSRRITIANAGLPYPMMLRDGRCSFLDLSGIPLGLFPDSKYQETEMELQPGNLLVFYSDGVVETRNEADEDFGLKRLADVVCAHQKQTAKEIVDAVNQSVQKFSGRARPHDDQTLIILKMSG